MIIVVPRTNDRNMGGARAEPVRPDPVPNRTGSPRSTTDLLSPLPEETARAVFHSPPPAAVCDTIPAMPDLSDKHRGRLHAVGDAWKARIRHHYRVSHRFASPIPVSRFPSPARGDATLQHLIRRGGAYGLTLSRSSGGVCVDTHHKAPSRRSLETLCFTEISGHRFSCYPTTGYVVLLSAVSRMFHGNDIPGCRNDSNTS